MQASELRLSILKEEHVRFIRILDEDLKSTIIDRSKKAIHRSIDLTRKWLDLQSIVLVRCHCYPQFFLLLILHSQRTECV
jgi:hypothetical protein